jgi:hypothetical protein
MEGLDLADEDDEDEDENENEDKDGATEEPEVLISV